MMRKLLAVVAMMAVAGVASAGQRMDTRTIYAATTDSSEIASQWFDVEGARRVIVKMWSEHAAWAADNADSVYSDSITTFKVLLSDSLSRTSVGALGADSVVFEPALAATFADTAVTRLIAHPLPINRALRAPANGTGLITVIAPVNLASATAWGADASGVMPKKYMRIRVTPLRRLTVSGFSSTAGKRVDGLKGFKMTVTVVRDDD